MTLLLPKIQTWQSRLTKLYIIKDLLAHHVAWVRMGTGNLNMTTIAESTCFRPKKLNFTASKVCLNVSACGNAGLVEDAVSSFCFSAVLQADSHVGEHNLCLCVFSQKGIAGLKPLLVLSQVSVRKSSDQSCTLQI